MLPDRRAWRACLARSIRQPLQLLGVKDPMQDVLVFAFARLPRARHLPHQQQTLAVLLIRKLERLRQGFEFGGISIGERDRHRAVLRFERNRREAVLGDEHVLEHGALEFVVMRDQAPALRIARRREERLRHRVSGVAGSSRHR